MWEKENNQLQLPIAVLFHLRGNKRQEAPVKVTDQGHKFTKRLRPNRIIEHFPSPALHQHISWAPITGDYI